MEQFELDFSANTSDYTKAELQLLTPDDVFSFADETLLLRLEEDRRVEHKPATIHGEELGQYFSMWANTPGGGLIVIGQRDKRNGGGFYGCCALHTQDALNEIEKRGQYHCPEAVARSKRISVTNIDGEADFVVLIHVQYHSRRVVMTLAGKAYARRGDEKIALNLDEIRALEAEKGQIDLELEPVQLQFPGDFRQDLIRQYVDNLVAEKRLSASHTDVQILSQTRLGMMNGHVFVPNLACALLFAKDPLTIIPGCRVLILRYPGELAQ